MGKIFDALKRAEEEARINKDISKSSAIVQLPIIEEKPKTGRPILQPIDFKGDKGLQVQPDLTLLTADRTIGKKGKRGFPFFNFSIGNITKNLTQRNLSITQNPHSLAAEQYKILRAHILNFSKHANIKTILVTSCLSEEGKSTVASNISICISNGINEYALLVDCDMRKPIQHKIFNLENRLGLSNYLKQDISLTQVMDKTKLEKLTIIPAGNPPNNPSELIASNKMIHLINELKSRYDDRYIIFDSTPVYQLPDAVILSKYVDGIILVIRSGRSNRDDIEGTIQSLGKDKILGIVFNMAKEPIRKNYYNHYYQHDSE